MADARPEQSSQPFRSARLSSEPCRLPARFRVNDLRGRNPRCRRDGPHLLATGGRVLISPQGLEVGVGHPGELGPTWPVSLEIGKLMSRR